MYVPVTESIFTAQSTLPKLIERRLIDVLAEYGFPNCRIVQYRGFDCMHICDTNTGRGYRLDHHANWNDLLDEVIEIADEMSFDRMAEAIWVDFLSENGTPLDSLDQPEDS